MNSIPVQQSKLNQLSVVVMSSANSHRDETTKFRFGLRLAAIIDYFLKLRETQQIDMFLLTEGRICRSADESEMLDALDIGYKIAKALGMWFTIMPNQNMNKMAFSKIVIYDPTRLFLLSTRNYYPGDSRVLPSGAQFSQCVSGLKFHRILPDTYDSAGQCVIDPKLIFNVGFVNAPMNKNGRDDFFKMMVQEFAGSDQPWIFPGDYNLFTEDSAEQNQLLDTHFYNMAPDIGTTFIGYPHDVDKDGVPFQSSLDRVYINYNFADQFGRDIEVQTENVTHQGVRISDHFLVTININFE